MVFSTVWIRRGLSTLLCLLPILTMVPIDPGREDGVASAPAAASADPALVIGGGVLEKLACLACIAGIVAVGGTSVFGVVVTALIYPEIVSLCGLGCAVAYG